MSGVVAHPKGATDDLGDPGQRPEIRPEAVGGGAQQQELQELGPLPRGDPRGSPGRGFGVQGIGASGSDCGPPAADGHRRTPDLPGDLAHPEPLVEEGDGPAPPRFQVCGAAMWSHASESTIVPLVMQASIVTTEGGIET